jgi:hypothetical protein
MDKRPLFFNGPFNIKYKLDNPIHYLPLKEQPKPEPNKIPWMNYIPKSNICFKIDSMNDFYKMDKKKLKKIF